ncbi:MAG: ribonuclease T [Rhodobacterales bacterium]|nr:MAG: ribonuclease T [Rhodobacterales bacterium]
MRLLIYLAFFCVPLAAWAKGERAGEFDYYVLAMSWSPNWCALEGEARGSEQCGRNLGWVLHGLWPQFERGWPSYCRHNFRAPSRSMTGAQADLFGTGGAAWYQWKKHGTCSGLAPAAYYDMARRVFEMVQKPEVLDRTQKTYALPASVIEAAFLEANPGWEADMLTVTCKAGHIQEARLCLTKDLHPRTCGPEVIRDCTLQDALFEPR